MIRKDERKILFWNRGIALALLQTLQLTTH